MAFFTDIRIEKYVGQNKNEIRKSGIWEFWNAGQCWKRKGQCKNMLRMWNNERHSKLFASNFSFLILSLEDFRLLSIANLEN